MTKTIPDVLNNFTVNQLADPLLQDVLNLAVKETIQLMEIGVVISDSSVITSLEWTANKYPEIAEQCNQILMDLIEKQESQDSKFTSISVNEILSQEF